MKQGRIPLTNLNLLRSLDALLSCQNVTAAAKSCHVTQSAMSASLKQLREVFDDPLLVRGRSGTMHLSNKALTLVNPTRILLQKLNHFFLSSPTLDMQNVKREINVGVPEYALTLFLPKLLEYLQEHAPNLVIQFFSLQCIETVDPFLRRDLDLAICFNSLVGDRVKHVELFSDEIVCVARDDHPIWQQAKPLCLEALLEYTQLVWSSMNHHQVTAFGEWCMQHNHERKVCVAVPNGVHLFQTIAQTDYVAQMTERYAQAYQDIYPFRYELIKRPKDYPVLSLNLFWHEISANDPVLEWLRQVIVDISQKLEVA